MAKNDLNMKKFFLLLTLLITSTFCCAQINRVFWGMTLGQSTKQQVKNVLVRKGYTVEIVPQKLKKQNFLFICQPLFVYTYQKYN